MNLQQIRRRVDQIVSDRDLAVKTVNQEQTAFDLAKQDVLDAVQAQKLIQEGAKYVQEKVHSKIAGVVTHCLNKVFEEHYEFKIKFVSKRGKTDALLVLTKDGMEFEDPLEECGGGVIDIASLALRLACLMLAKPKGRRLLVLDEPFKNINGTENRKRARDLLVTLANDFKCQLIIATGLDYLKGIGKEIEIGETDA